MPTPSSHAIISLALLVRCQGFRDIGRLELTAILVTILRARFSVKQATLPDGFAMSEVDVGRGRIAPRSARWYLVEGLLPVYGDPAVCFRRALPVAQMT